MCSYWVTKCGPTGTVFKLDRITRTPPQAHRGSASVDMTFTIRPRVDAYAYACDQVAMSRRWKRGTTTRHAYAYPSTGAERGQDERVVVDAAISSVSPRGRGAAGQCGAARLVQLPQARRVEGHVQLPAPVRLATGHPLAASTARRPVMEAAAPTLCHRARRHVGGITLFNPGRCRSPGTAGAVNSSPRPGRHQP